MGNGIKEARGTWSEMTKEYAENGKDSSRS